MKEILELINDKKYDEALNLVEIELKVKSNNLELMCARAEILKKQNKFTDAVNQYIRIIDKHPNYKKAQVEKDLLHNVMLQDNLDIFASTNLFDDPWEII